jgi:hypothetical protein
VHACVHRDECSYVYKYLRWFCISNIYEFRYGVSGVPERYLEVSKIFLISIVDFYYVINKLIILVHIYIEFRYGVSGYLRGISKVNSIYIYIYICRDEDRMKSVYYATLVLDQAPWMPSLSS